MLFELPPVWTVLLNLTAWLAIHLGVAWAGTRAPKRLFDPAHPLYRIRSWERKSSFYERLLGIRSWKDRLPDWGGRFRGGFFKKSLETSSPEYLQRFILETCRGEAVHWAVLSLALPFFLWNPWWAGVIMVLYAAAVNLPCIMVQRYNRFRLTLLMNRMTRPGDLRVLSRPTVSAPGRMGSPGETDCKEPIHGKLRDEPGVETGQLQR